MATQQFVDQHKRRLARVMIERANSNIRVRRRSKDYGQVGVSRADNGRAGDGVVCYTSAESQWTLTRGDDLSQEISNENALRERVTLAMDRAYRSDDLAIGAVHLDHCPDA